MVEVCLKGSNVEGLRPHENVWSSNLQMGMHHEPGHESIDLFLVYAELLGAATHAHLCSADLEEGIDANPHTHHLSHPGGNVRKAAQLALGLHVDGLDTQSGCQLQLGDGLPRASEDGSFGRKACPLGQKQLSNGGDFCSQALSGDQLADADAWVGLQRVVDLRFPAQRMANPLYLSEDYVSVVNVVRGGELVCQFGHRKAAHRELRGGLSAKQSY